MSGSTASRQTDQLRLATLRVFMLMSLPAFIPCPERTVKLSVFVRRPQILLDVRVSFAASRRVQRSLEAAAIILLVVVEVAPVAVIVRAFTVAQLAPPLFAQLVEVHGAGPGEHFVRLVHLVFVFGVRNDHRVAVA